MNEILCGDALTILKGLPAQSVQCCVTSPPYYGLRDYDIPGQIGLEETPEAYVDTLVEVFREVRRVLRNDGTLWVNIGDSYSGGTIGRVDSYHGREIDGRQVTAKQIEKPRSRKIPKGLKPKDIIGIPWMLAFALRTDGWYLRSPIVWVKSTPMPDGVTDRPTSAYEHIFLLAKSERYFYDADAIREGTGANKRNVWRVTNQPYSEAHFATFPPKLIEPCILAGSHPGDVVLDCFMGAGTVAMVAIQHGRNYLGIELHPEYVKIAEKRISNVQMGLWTTEGIAV
jgi:site-specific DNA-methyltransferase (cytosine-N4-specific)